MRRAGWVVVLVLTGSLAMIATPPAMASDGDAINNPMGDWEDWNCQWEWGGHPETDPEPCPYFIDTYSWKGTSAELKVTTNSVIAVTASGDSPLPVRLKDVSSGLTIPVGFDDFADPASAALPVRVSASGTFYDNFRGALIALASMLCLVVFIAVQTVVRSRS